MDFVKASQCTTFYTFSCISNSREINGNLILIHIIVTWLFSIFAFLPQLIDVFLITIRLKWLFESMFHDLWTHYILYIYCIIPCCITGESYKLLWKKKRIEFPNPSNNFMEDQLVRLLYFPTIYPDIFRR